MRPYELISVCVDLIIAYGSAYEIFQKEDLKENANY